MFLHKTVIDIKDFFPCHIAQYICSFVYCLLMIVAAHMNKKK
jgi:Zn-finger protein